VAVYTFVDRQHLLKIAEDYGLGRLLSANGVTTGSVNTNYRLECTKGKFFLKIDEVKGELEVKRELELLLYLQKHGFPCPQPLADCHGRYYQELGGKCVSVYKYAEGKAVRPEKLTLGQLETIGRVLADLHVLGKIYKKGIDNRFSFERVLEIYREVRRSLPAYFKRMIRTLDEEIEYLQNYLEGKLPKGIIHGDLFFDNLLFRGDRLTAVLDFEASCRGKFIFDLATAVNALCFEGGRYILEKFEAILGGYEQVRTLSLAEWDAFPNELRFSALRFTVTRLKDFFLSPVSDEQRVNKDFREFFDRLSILRREKEGGMEALLMAMATGYDYRKYQRVRALEKKSRG